MAKAKEIVGLDCDASAERGLSLILTTRLDEMNELGAAALDWNDPKGVHDMRVASRRLRSALKDCVPYLRQNEMRRVSEELKRIADALGAVRDLDVTLAEFELRAGEAPASMAAGIKELAGAQRRKLEKARAELAQAIEADALAELEAEFEEALERGLKVSRKRGGRGEKNGSGRTSLSLKEVGREIIKTDAQELEERSAGLYRPFKVKPLHRMRIASKRLRYAVQLFAPCLGEALATFAKEISRLQTSLGDLHDCDVWIGELGRMLLELNEEAASETKEQDGKTQDAPAIARASSAKAPEQLRWAAAVWLLNHFVKARTRHFQDALARWQEWAASGFLSRLLAVVEEQKPSLELTPANSSPIAAAVADLRASEEA